MYDQSVTVDRYDTAFVADGISTFKSSLELEFLDMVERMRLRSVLDLGCGAGAFYHLLSSVAPGIRYHGYDLSAAQIERAHARFGNGLFSVRDISTISADEFARYDAVHAYSVFSFMSIPQQLAVIERIVRSGARLLTQTGVTIPHIHYVPRSVFANFGKLHSGSRALVTVVSFPFRSQLERALRSSTHVLSYSEQEYTNTRALNRLIDKHGAALADRGRIRQKRQMFERVLPFSRRLRLLVAKVSPQDWVEMKPETYENLEVSEIYDTVVKRLKAH